MATEESKPVTIQEFREMLQKDVDGFFDRWQKDAAENPDMWPTELDGVGEWYEQFLAHYTASCIE